MLPIRVLADESETSLRNGAQWGIEEPLWIEVYHTFPEEKYRAIALYAYTYRYDEQRRYSVSGKFNLLDARRGKHTVIQKY